MGVCGLTASLSGAHGAVGGVGGVAADVAYPRIVEALVAKMLAIHVLDAPEAAGCDGGFFGSLGNGDGGGTGHCGGLGEWTEEAGEN